MSASHKGGVFLSNMYQNLIFAPSFLNLRCQLSSKLGYGHVLTIMLSFCVLWQRRLHLWHYKLNKFGVISFLPASTSNECYIVWDAELYHQ